MKRERNRSGHAAVLVHQLIERRNGLGIAQYDGDLPASRHGGGLALCAGQGLHVSARGLAELSGRCFKRGDIRGVGLLGLGQLPGDLIAAHLGDCFDERGHCVGAAGILGLHFVSPWRANPADEPSSHVTSNLSTTVRRPTLSTPPAREAAAA